MKIQWTYEQSMKSSDHCIKNNSADEKKIMKDSAVSEVIGVMLLLGAAMTLSVVFASTAGVLVSDTDSPVNAEIIYVGDDGTDYIFEAASGDGAAASDLKIVYGLREDNTKYDSYDVSSSYGFIETGERFSISMPSFITNNGQHVIYKFYDTKTGKKISSGEIYINKPTPTPTPEKYTVTFNSNGGTGTMSDQIFTEGVEHSLSPNTFSKMGHTFKEWNTKNDGTGTVYSDGQSIKVYDNMILYAVWTPKKYTVTFNGNGNTDGTMEVQSIEYGKSTPLDKNKFNKTGYKFRGWNNTLPSGTVVNYADRAPISITENVILYAVWIKPIEDDYGQGYIRAMNEYLDEYHDAHRILYIVNYQWITEYIRGFTENYQGCDDGSDKGYQDGMDHITKDMKNLGWFGGFDSEDGYEKGKQRALEVNQN